MRVAVTGATGFVGRHLVTLLLQRGHEVRILARSPARAAPLTALGADAIPGHLADGPSLAALTRDAHTVVHLVGIITESGAARFDTVHVEGTRRVLEAARAAGVRRFVHMSALGARSEARATRYHRTKWEAEELVRGSGVPAVIFRPSLISGPESVPIRLLGRLHRWSPVIPVFGRADFPLQPVWIEDVALAFALALEAGTTGTFELGGPDVLTYAAFVRAIGRAVQYPRPLVGVPLPLVRLVARACDGLGPLAPVTSDQIQMLVEGAATRQNAIARTFGIAALGFEEGLRRIFPKNQTRG